MFKIAKNPDIWYNNNMAKIPLPQTGQPLDVSYIYQLANAINDLATQVVPSNYKFVTIDTPAQGKQSLKNSEIRMVAAHINVANNRSVNSGNEQEFSYEFDSDFSGIPIVTATVFNYGTTDVGNSATVVIKKVTTGRIDGVVRFGSNGNLSVGVNIIAVGVPSNG